ncbi:MAG: hypothetical protein IJR99_00135, partial [Kiritimatiellae bacterium]|nr:hypothetical protein [Kiritimatiellia bacterium]
VLRLVVSLMLCLVALTVLSVLCWLDSNRTVIVPYADYVDSYGLPEGIAPLEAGSLKGRNVHYRFEYRGYSLGPSIHADHVTAPFLQRLGFHRVLRRVVQSHSSGAPIRLESWEDAPRPPVQEFEYEQDWPNVAKRVKRILHRDVTGLLLKRLDLNVAKDGTVNGLIQFFGSETDQAVPLLALVPKSIDMGLPSSLAVAASRVAARNPFALHRFGDERKARVAISQHLVKRNPQGRAIQILFRSVYDAPVLDTLGSCGYDFDLDKEGRVVAHWNLSQDETGGYLRGADKFGILGHKNVYSGGRLVRIEFVDESQRPVIGPFGWKICVNEFDGNGNAVRSTFLDERGISAPSLDGVFGHREGYDASGNRTNRVFLSKTGGVTFDKNGIAEKRWKYNANGDIVEESYWDRDGAPMFSREHGTAGYRLQYDGRRFVSSKVWIGRDGKPMQCRHGVVEKRSRYDGQGRIEEEMVYGSDGNPVLLTDYRVAGYRIAYDNRGMMASKIWLGVDGRPAMHDGGFAETRWKYDERGNLAEERMYDDAGIPVSSTKLGYAGFHVTYDDRGLEIRRSQLDSNGQPSERGLAEFRWKYDDRGNRIEELWYTASGNRFVNRTRCMGCRMECDEHGRETRKVWIGPDGEPARNGRSADERRKFDSRGNLIEERLYDEKGEPVPTGLDGAYGFAEEYDEYDRKVRRVWLSKDGSPLKREGTICEIRRAYDNYGNITNEFYLGPDGKPVADPNGVARIGRAYRANPGNIFRIDLWGMTNSPCVFGTSNVWHKVTRYDQNARITNECYYSVQDTPVAGPFGMVCWTHEYDADGNRIKWSGYDAEGARFEVVRQLIRIRDVAPGSPVAQCGVRRGDILCRIDEEDLLDIGLSEDAYRARVRIIYDKKKERKRLLVARRGGTGFQVKECECPCEGMMVSPLPALQDDFNVLQNACRPFLEER